MEATEIATQVAAFETRLRQEPTPVDPAEAILHELQIRVALARREARLRLLGLPIAALRPVRGV